MNKYDIYKNCVKGSNSFVDSFKEICDNAKKVESLWIDALKRKGIKASHPNDGWHNRENKSFQLVYPEYNEGVKIGDVVALGNPDECIFVTITDITKGIFGNIYYHYEFKE